MTAPAIADLLRSLGWELELESPSAIHALSERNGEPLGVTRRLALTTFDAETWLLNVWFERLGSARRIPITERTMHVRTLEDLEMVLAGCGPKSHMHRVGA